MLLVKQVSHDEACTKSLQDNIYHLYPTETIKNAQNALAIRIVTCVIKGAHKQCPHQLIEMQGRMEG